METNRREFLKGTAWMGAAAVAAGCVAEDMKIASGGAMQGYAAPALKKVRVGVAGLGMRGPGAVHRLSSIPGVEVAALCDIHRERVDAQQTWLEKNGKPKALEFVGAEAYKAMCDSSAVDVIYNATSWDMHVPIALYAMRAGKHAMVEVPSAFTVDECWELVKTSEETRMHCMQLENCCYGEAEMLALNLVRQGLLGETVHGEGAYIHDLRDLCYRDWAPAPTDEKYGYENFWRLRHNAKHKGNQYDTHGLGPVCQYMNINRGDRFDYLVSLESNQFNYEFYAKENFTGHPWKPGLKIAMGDMNTTLVKTVNGKSIAIQHDVSSPRPYSRINRITGTRGALEGITFLDDYGTGKNAPDPADVLYSSGCFCRFGWEDRNGAGVHRYFGAKKAEEMRAKYRHPLWKRAGEFAKLVGGHGGMDFLMDLRWCYCLQNGLPLDTDVYDLASWCCLAELSEKSVKNRSRSMDVPDFTSGGWKTAEPLGIVDVDLVKMGFEPEAVKTDNSQLNV
jgi:hypothetical protein